MKLALEKIVGDGDILLLWQWRIVVVVAYCCGSGGLLWQWRVVVAVAYFVQWRIVVAVAGCCGSGLFCAVAYCCGSDSGSGVLLWQWRVVAAVAYCCGSFRLLKRNNEF